MPTPQLPRIEELEYWSTGEKARLAKAGTLSGSDTVTIPIELYEKMVAQSKQIPPPPVDAAEPAKKHFANPTPVGLFGLFITTMAFSSIELGLGGANQLNGILGSLFFTGPVLLLISSVAEWVAGNFFAFLVSGAMGVFWLSLGVLYIPALGIAASYSPDGTDAAAGFLSVGFNASLGIYLICWGLGTFVILICSMKTNLTFIILFAVLDAAFFMFSASHFQTAAGNLGTALVLQKIGAGCTFIVALLLFYLLCVTMFDEMGVGIHLPLGDVNALVAARQAPPSARRSNSSHSHDHYEHRHEHRHRHHDEENQWNPRISLPLPR